METALHLPTELNEIVDECKRSLRVHTYFVHGYTMPDHQLVWAEALEDMSIDRLLLIAPPKYGKSPTVGVDYQGWRIGKDHENYHSLYISNTSRQATKYSVALRDTVAYNPNYRFLYPDVIPDVSKGWSEAEWFVKRANLADKDPTLQAAGVGGPILGATVEEVIFDDIADEENMATAYQREKLFEWVQSTAMSRLVPGVSRAVMICTRWHEEDPSSLFEKAGWVVIQIPALNEDGSSTFPKFWPVGELAKRKVDLGTRKFEMMFQGNILPSEGGIFKEEWWRYWDATNAPWIVTGDGNKPILGVIQSWDTAHKEKKESAFSCCETWYVIEDGYYLVDVWRGKVDYPKLKKVAKALALQWLPVAVLIEDAASGIDLIADFSSDSTLPVVAITVSTDKVARANAALPTIEAGNVKVSRDAGWRADWEYEHEVFPAGKYKDQVDTTTQFLNWIRSHPLGGQTRPSGQEKESTWRGQGEMSDVD